MMAYGGKLALCAGIVAFMVVAAPFYLIGYIACRLGWAR